MSDITPARLSEIRARVDQATLPDWTLHSDESDLDYGMRIDGVFTNWRGEKYARIVALLDDEDDAAFILHARTDVPDLLAEIDRLKGIPEQAWEEGFTPGFYDVRAGKDRDASESTAVNPYETEADPDE